MLNDVDLLSIRPFSPEGDLLKLLNLVSSVEAIDQEGAEISEQALQDQLNLPGHEPTRDRWVIDAPGDTGALIAAALVWLNPATQTALANIIVHPEWRQRGVGERLFPQVIDRLHELKATCVQIFAGAKHKAAQDFLTRHGFTPQGAYTELRLAQGIVLPPVIWPFGYSMRTYAEVQDISILTQAMNLSYIPLWGHHEVTEAEMATWMQKFNADGLFLVFSEKGRVVGISCTEPSPERTQKNGVPTGYIDAPGVVPQHRRLDLYRALVLTGIGWLREQGQSIIEMESWGDKLEVLKMYRELGFKDIRQRICYELDLSAQE